MIWLRNVVVDHEAPVGDLDRRAQRLAQGDRAPLPQRGLPGRRRPGHADGDAADTRLLERVRQPGGRVDERVLPHGRRRGLPAVDGVHRPWYGRRRRRRSRRRRYRPRTARSRPSVAAAATAASTALPPCRNTSMATRVASMSTVDAAPPRPTATGALVTDGVACAGDPVTRVPARAATISTDNAVVRRTIITPPSVRHYDQSPDEYTPVFQGARPRQCAGDDHKYAVPRPQGHQRPRRVEAWWWNRDLPPHTHPGL